MNLYKNITHKLSDVLESFGVKNPKVELEYPADMSHGDYSSNIAMAYAKELGKNPREFAEEVVSKLGDIEGVEKIEVAGAGFINFYFSSAEIFKNLDLCINNEIDWGRGSKHQDKHIMVEYTDPNPFKEFHIGHLMSNAIGEAIARLLEFSGARVVRANYQGDLGVHVACAIWGIRELGIDPKDAKEHGRAYAYGANAYKEDEDAKKDIDNINKSLYEKSDEGLNKIYDDGKKASLDRFEEIYKTLGTKFDEYFFESETAPIGKNIIEENEDLFPESDGARIFRGEDYGLHTRVFVNKTGLVTYEGKELGLEKLKYEKYPDLSGMIVITANEITEYFKVIKSALGEIYPHIAEKLHHIPHGMMRLKDGKMSSRTGDVISGLSIISELERNAVERFGGDMDGRLAKQVAVSALKYQILKQVTDKDIVFDKDRALALEGDSGPYLQYTYARCVSVLDKGSGLSIDHRLDDSLNADNLERFLIRFPDIVERAANEYEPHYVTQYIIEVASMFNSWYAKEKILDGGSEQAHKLSITKAVAVTIKNGLWLLGIEAPERM